MYRYQSVKSTCDVMTFEEFILYGLMVSGSVNAGIPMSFDLYGFRATHENNECYILEIGRFTKNDVLLVKNGNLFICNKETFLAFFIPYEATKKCANNEEGEPA